MASLIWQAWPRITLEQSQALYAHFAKQGSVVAFRGARKHLVGPSGHGIVVYKDVESIDKLLQGQESVDMDLRHLFEDPTSTTKQDTSPEPDSSADTPSTELQPGSSWIVNIRNNHKTPSTVSMESMLAKRRTKITRLAQLFDDFPTKGLSKVPEWVATDAVKSELRTILEAEMSRIREVEEQRGHKRGKPEPVNSSSDLNSESAPTAQESLSDEVVSETPEDTIAPEFDSLIDASESQESSSRAEVREETRDS